MSIGMRIAAVVVGVMASVALAQEEKSLFNGKDLSGWDGNPEVWSVEDGAITGQTKAEKPIERNTFLIWQGGKVGDFELNVKFRIFAGNTGIQYRSVDKGNWSVTGYQADLDFGKNYAGMLYEEGGRGFMVPKGVVPLGKKSTIEADGTKKVTGEVSTPEEIRKSIKDGEWNTYTIIAKGNVLTQKVNGITTMEVTDNQVEKRALEGILALQVHKGPPMKVQFKDIVLKTIK